MRHFLNKIPTRSFASFKPFIANQTDIDKLNGSYKNLSGLELTKHRGNYLNEFWKTNPYYQFLGTSTGISAVNVVAGGMGRVGPYVGGWQINAMKNRLQDTLPDTLHVSPEEPANCAVEVNNHLTKADQIQHLNNQNYTRFHDCGLLADLEQGWSNPEKVRYAVKKAILNGINVIHIEDQGPFKRCGHLGDKELCPIEDYVMIMKAANFAAQELLEKGQTENNWVRFVARTDAFSAKRMLYSQNLMNPTHLDNKFIDWDRGLSPDGKYAYIKEGVNPETGKKWGLEMSIARTAEIVKQGLASHVWMETPNAELTDAKDFLEGVNAELAKYDMEAKGLYNHSPSFDWDVKFYQSAKSLVDNITQKTELKPFDSQFTLLQDLLEKEGDKIQGDDKMNADLMASLTFAINDFHQNRNYKNYLNESPDNFYSYQFLKNTQFKTPYDIINDIVVENRLKMFEPQLASFGFNAHLITLPEYHVMAFNMFNLAEQFQREGMWAYVSQVQRPERIKYEEGIGYQYYKHQTTTGTGLEAEFNKAVGSANSNILSGSTETDDSKLRNK